MKPVPKALLLMALFIAPLGGYFFHKSYDEAGWAETILLGNPMTDHNPTAAERQTAGIEDQMESGMAEIRRSIGVALLGTAGICLAIASVTTSSPILRRWIKALSYNINRIELN